MLIVKITVEVVKLRPTRKILQEGHKGKILSRLSKIVLRKNNGRKTILHPKRRGRREMCERSRFGGCISLDAWRTGESREGRTFGGRAAGRGRHLNGRQRQLPECRRKKRGVREKEEFVSLKIELEGPTKLSYHRSSIKLNKLIIF